MSRCLREVWTSEQENLLASWSERASGYRWLHSRSEKLYRKRNYAFTIPVIILSTLTGTANFAMDSFVPEEHKQMAMACVGGVNIFGGTDGLEGRDFVLRILLRFILLLLFFRGDSVICGALKSDGNLANTSVLKTGSQPCGSLVSILSNEYSI